MAPDHVLEDATGALVTVERACDGLDRAGRDLVALANEVGHLADNRAGGGHGLVLAVEREHVPAQKDLAVEMLLEGLHHRVAGPGELSGDLIRKLELDSHDVVAT